MIDREAEREWALSHLVGMTASFLVVYGRRRVGKTTLVTHVLEHSESAFVYYLCDQRGTEPNARAFAEQCADALDDVPPAVDGFVDAFRYLARRVDEPFVVAL